MYRELMPFIALTGFSASAVAQESETTFIAISEDEQVLRQSLIVDAPLAQVWARFTTDEGVASWMAPVGEVDLRSGGAIRTNYDACAAVGDDGGITLDIVNFVPEQFIILKTDLSANSDAEWMNDAILQRGPDMSNLIEFEALDEQQTRITSWGLGYGTGEDWEQMIAFFSAGNDWSFGQLRRALAGETVYAPCADSED